MSYNNFGRGRGFGPQGTRAVHRFGRPRFPRPPFRHAGPPRPGHPPSFGMPWQPHNMFFQPHPLRGSLQFRPDGRRRRFCNYDVRFPAPNILPVPPEYEEAVVSPSSSLPLEANQNETVPQLPLLGSEEERQQKITETADRLKQKLSSFSSDKNIWSEDVSFGTIEDDCIDNRCIPTVGYKSIELSLTYNDLKDIGKINPDNTKLDNKQHTTDTLNVISNNIDNDVILDENEDGSHLIIPSDQMTNLENAPDDNEYTVDNWELHEPVDNLHNLEQSDLHEDNNTENELLESDVQYQYNTPPADISQDQNDQQQDTSQGIEIYPIDVTKEQDESETQNLQAVSFPIDSAGQDILQRDVSQREEKLLTNLEVEESVLNSQVNAESSNSSNCTLTQPALADMSVNNVALDNQLPRVKKNSFHSGPPKLSPHTEQELPIDFDPTTPPPILLKQEHPHILPPYSISDLPPLFDPTAPPPNIKCLLGSSHEDANPAWSNAQNPMPATYTNIEVHTGLNAHGGFMSQQLPLEMSSQSNVFLPPHIDSVNFSPIFPMPSSSHSGINTHVPPTLPQMHVAPHNTYVPSSSLPDLASSSVLFCSVNKDDGLNDMQEAMKFAKEMTSITEKTDEESKSNSTSLSESSTSIKPISDVKFIALPPGKPKAKTIKLRRMKRDDICSKKKIVPEEQSTAGHLSSQETIQDANAKSKDASLVKEQDRPKVVFNLNNKMKILNAKTAWQENEKKNGMTQSMESEKTHAALSTTKKNFENTLKRNKEEEKNLKRNENSSESAILSESIANQDTISSHKKQQKDVNTEKSQRSSVSLRSKVNMQKLRSHVEKNENSNTEASWKNRIISRFLKMSKNDIYNMVNNTSLRKFDIIMKRLVKEKKPTLSLKMRHAQDEKMKLYDQQEFMEQLNAMLNTDAIVSITDLPTEFIHHLNEVLQLDVQPDNHGESTAASSSQCGHSEDTNHAFSPVTHTTMPECANKTISNDVSQECVRNKSHTTKSGYNKDIQAHNTKSNDLNLKDDTCNTIVDNVSNISSNLLTLQHDLDDIFSEVTKKIQIPTAVKERKRCSMGQQNVKKFDVGVILRNVENEAILEDDIAHKSENCPLWDEKCDKWKKKEREDPHAYRNLTKEEWEARYGTQANSIPSIPSISSILSIPFVSIKPSVSTKPSVLSIKRIDVDNKKLPNRGRGRKCYPRRRYSSESSKHPHTRPRTLEKDKHKKSRRHSDDRRHSIEYLEHNNSIDHNSNNNSSSSSSSSSSSTSSSDSSDNTNVTKLLRVIKEKEKVAKKMSLNEAIRDEVNAEIERERKSKKSRKKRNRKQRKAHHKKKKKKTMSSSDFSSEKDNNEEATDRLLSENEIKKEVVENQITQEVIVKEELDIGQEENTGDAEFANASSLMVMENKAAYLLPASQSRLESPSTQEISLTTVNATQLHAEDRLPTASPTQPKTKAQLKQMPETSDLNANKVSLNIFTCIPEDWNMLNPASFSEYTETLINDEPCQTIDTGCNQDKTVISTIDSFTNQNDNTVHISCGEANKSPVQQQLDAAVCTSTESSTKIQDGNEISATDDTSKVSTVATSASSVSSVPPANTTTHKQGASKKIDIKTYYERTRTQRRMNEKLESKKSVESPATSTQNLSTSKTTEPEIAVNKSTFIYSGSIQDPRLASRLAVIPCANSKDDIAQTTSKKNIQQEKRTTKGSTIAKLAPRRPGENSNRIVNSDSAVKKINQDKSKDKVSLTANSNALSNVVTTSKIAAPKSQKRSRENVTDKKLQSKDPSDPKRFKNIRSEGGKELKLKKEVANEQKAKKKSAVASKSPSLVSTKVYFPLEEITKAVEMAQEKTDNISDINKVEIERTQLTSSRKIKINNNNIKIESSIISSGNTDNDDSELSHDIVKVKERSSNLEILEQGNAEEAVNNIESNDAREHSSETTRNEENRNIKNEKDIANVEKKDQSAREICNVILELDVSKTSKIVPEISIHRKLEKVDKDDFSTSIKIQQSDTIKNMELSLNYGDQNQIEKANRQDVESTIDMSSISELNVMSRLDSVDKQSKEDQLLINNDIEINNTKENNKELLKNNTDVLDDTYKSASANADNSLAKKSIELSSASNESSREQQGTKNADISPDSVGSPFKGFLQETMMDFEQPNLYNVKLDEIDANKNKFLNDCNVNYATRTASCTEMKIEGRQDYEILSATDYANDTNIGENFNIAFGDTLLASDKECATSEKSDKSDLMTDESGEGHVRNPSSEIVASTLHDEDNNINIGEGSETERQLIGKDGYASCAGLVIKESMFINEEEIIQGEARSKDLASKLKTTTDPSLSDALEATISDDALPLPESQSAEHLDNHIYLETNISAEKTPCDKLPDFDSDEHLDNDMFYLDDRLQSTATFDNKDDECVHFSDDRQSPRPRYDITPAVTPETTMIAPCAEMSRSEECKFDLKQHISSTDNDLLAGASMERSPRTLNIPTKAALKEAATNLLLKPSSNVPTATKEAALGMLDKTRQGEADLNYQTPAWRADVQNNIKTHPPETHNNTTAAQEFINVNTISSTPTRNSDGPACKGVGINHKMSITPSSIENRLRGGMQRNPVVELRKMKELDKLLEKKGRENAAKAKGRIRENQKKHNGTILHKLKDKRQMKYQSKGTSGRISLVKRLKKMKRTGQVISTTREAILARMLEIDLEMHKLATEKLKLHEMLKNNVPSTEDSAANGSAVPRTREDDTVPGKPEIPSMLTPQLAQNNRAKQAKHVPSSRSSLLKDRKRILSRNSEDDENVSYTQRTKMPVIRWKKKPRLEQTVRREEDEEDEEEEDLDEATKQQTSTSVSKKIEDCSIDASKDIIQKSESNGVTDHEAREEETTEISDKEAACDVDSKRAICSDKSATDKNTDERSERQDFAEGDAERAKHDTDKRNDILPLSEAVKVNFQPSSRQVHNTPEPLSIYSDDSTWDSLVQNTASEMHENRKATGLVLLDETLKKELARTRKMKAIVRKKKKEQLDNFLRTVNKLTMEEEELPLSKLYIKKLRQKRDLLDSLSQRKEDTDLIIDSNILKNMDEVINAVAENRVEDLYEPQSEARASDDIPAAANISPMSQPDKHQFYVDAEANANSDWPCREKENIEEVASHQDSSDVPGTEGSNHVFKAVNQDKVPFYDERNVEPDSSITPEETLIESHSSDCERARPKDSNNIMSRNFDIRVSVPKTLIKDDFSLLQKLKDTEGGVVGTCLVDSTTNALPAGFDRVEENDKNSRNASQATKPPIVEEDKKDEKGETKDKSVADANEREETVDGASNAPSVPQPSTAKTGYSDATENEESAESITSNQSDKVAIKDTERDSSISDSTVEKIDTKQKKSDAESDQLSNDAITLKQDCQSVENAAAKEEEKSNPENKSRAFESILDNDPSTGSSVPADLASERSEDSNEAFNEQQSRLERTLTSTFSFNKATVKGGEPSKKIRRKQGNLTPVRRSTRNSNETVKPSKINEADANSSSNEREPSVLHERDLTTRNRNKSPTLATRDERIANNVRKNRVTQKVQNASSRRVSAEPEAKVEDPVKRLDVIAASAVSKNKTVVIAKKRKQQMEWQMKNCKVKLIDCKPTLSKYIDPGVLDKLGIIADNPCTPTDSSYESCKKENPEIEILEEKPITESNDKDLIEESVSHAAEMDEEESTRMQYTVHEGPILDIKIFENSFLAASEDSKIYRYSQMSNGILNIYKGHKSAVTCLYIYKSDIAGVNKELMYSGSLDGTLRCYNITTGALVKSPAQINSPIQCMDQAWGLIFIGTKSGYVSRFHIKTGVIKGNIIQFSDRSVLALKATNEGPRRILIVASRNQPITIRDAQTGLFLRTISGQNNHTVYSLLRHDNLIYCGTSSKSINVFDFTMGEQVIQYDAGVGIVCMRLYKQLLFAGCYNGNIYVFDINNRKLVCSIHGPGNMLLSIEVVNNKIIAGSKDKRLHSWQMPTQVRALL